MTYYVPDLTPEEIAYAEKHSANWTTDPVRLARRDLWTFKFDGKAVERYATPDDIGNWRRIYRELRVTEWAYNRAKQNYQNWLDSLPSEL